MSTTPFQGLSLADLHEVSRRLDLEAGTSRERRVGPVPQTPPRTPLQTPPNTFVVQLQLNGTISHQSGHMVSKTIAHETQ